MRAANPSDTLKDLLLAALDENKAEDVVAIPLEGKSSLCDYMIIASGRSARHVVALSELLGAALQKIGRTARYEGRENGDWVLCDAGDVIVHIFRPEVREFYNLEKMWSQSEAVSPNVASTPRRRKAVATV